MARVFAEKKCLIILDNLESILEPRKTTGKFRSGYTEYERFLKIVGTSKHQSSLLITSREKPLVLRELENDKRAFTHRLEGLSNADSQRLLVDQGVESENLEEIADRFNGNPLALKIVSSTIKDLFQKQTKYLLGNETSILGGIEGILEEQFGRASSIERKLLFLLCILREPIENDRLKEIASEYLDANLLFRALESLSRKSLIESHQGYFSLQAVILEYITDKIIEEIASELISESVELVCMFPLLRLDQQDYIQKTQSRMLLEPIIEKLKTNFTKPEEVHSKLKSFFSTKNFPQSIKDSYLGGNLINLLNLSTSDFSCWDLSSWGLLHADFRKSRLQNSNLSGCNLRDAAFAAGFGGIWTIAVLGSTGLFFSGDTKGNLALRKTKNGRPVRNYIGHSSWIVNSTISPNQTLLATSSCDCTARIWDIESGNCLHVLEMKQEVWGLDFSPCGRYVVTGSDDSCVRVWDVSTGELLSENNLNNGEIISVAFSKFGQHIYTSGHQKEIYVLNANDLSIAKVIVGCESGHRDIALSSDESWLAVAGMDTKIRIWDLPSSSLVQEIKGMQNFALTLKFSPGDRFLVAGGYDKSIRFYDPKNGQLIKTSWDHSNYVRGLDFAPSKNLMITGSYDQTMKVWDLKSLYCLQTFHGFSNQTLSVRFSNDHQTLISAGHDQRVRIWNTESGLLQNEFQAHDDWIFCSLMHKLNNSIAITSSVDQSIKVWNLDNEELVHHLNGHTGSIRSIDISADGKRIFSGSDDTSTIVWDIETGGKLLQMNKHSEAIWSVCCSPIENIGASSSFDGMIYIWNLESGALIGEIAASNTWIWAIRFSSDGNEIISTAADQKICIWDLETKVCIAEKREDEGQSMSLAVCPQGNILATARQDHSIRLWNKSDFSPIEGVFEGHTALVNSLSFSADGKLLASSGEDETIRIWEIETQKCLQCIKIDSPYLGMQIDGIKGIEPAMIKDLINLGAKRNSILSRS